MPLNHDESLVKRSPREMYINSLALWLNQQNNTVVLTFYIHMRAKSYSKYVISISLSIIDYLFLVFNPVEKIASETHGTAIKISEEIDALFLLTPSFF